MKKTFRNILLWLTSTLMSLSVIGVVALMPKTQQVSAAEPTTWQTGTFEMDNGASLALSKKGGLRFIVRMDETVKTFITENSDVEFGFRIAPKNLMIQANGDYLNMPQYVGGAADKTKIYQDEKTGEWLANGCIVGVKAANLTRSFTAVAYIKQGETVRYTAYNDLARNNLYDTVNMAVLTGDYTEELFGDYKAGGYVQNGVNVGWYGSEQYPIVVENAEEYAKLQAVANDLLVDLSKYHVIVNGSVDYAGSDFAETPASIQSQGVYTLNNLIAALPTSVTMPDAIGQIPRIREAEKQYKALRDSEKSQITTDYTAKLNSLLQTIEGYDRVYKHDFDDGTAIPAYLVDQSSTIGGTPTTRQDSVEGNVLRVTPNAGGKMGLFFENFPDVSKYQTIYFKVRVLGETPYHLYMSDGIVNDGWGQNWKNNSGKIETGEYYCGNKFKLISVDVSSGYFGTNFAMQFLNQPTDVAYEITDFYGIQKGVGDKVVNHIFGNTTDSGETNEYGTVYNIVREQYYINTNDSATIGTIEQNELPNVLPEGYKYFYFWMYNPFTTQKLLKMEGSIEGQGWIAADTKYYLEPQAWTKVSISNKDIQNNAKGTWYVYLENSDADGWKISPLYYGVEMSISLNFGVKTDAGVHEEYGKIYNITREQYYINENINNTIGTLNAGVLANALPDGYEHFYFWMYNPTATEYNFHLAGSCTSGWTDSADFTTLTPNAWTKVVISATDISLNTQGQWYVYILGGSNTGAAQSGWQISTIYAGPVPEQKAIVYTDHADLKATIRLIDAIPATVSVGDIQTIKKARQSYDALTAEQQALVGNYSKLTAAEAVLDALVAAEAVVDKIDAIDANNIDIALVQAARTAYDALSDTAKSYVTNYQKLVSYEEAMKEELALKNAAKAVDDKLSAIPEDIKMPDNLVFVPRIEAARDAYNVLLEEAKQYVTAYDKLERLLKIIKGYETVHIQTVDAVDVIASYVPNNTSTIGGTAELGYHSYYGNYLKVTSASDGTAAIQYSNFPNVNRYSKIYFNVRLVGTSADVYLSDGITNKGWGDNWHNTWDIVGLWVDADSWSQKSIDVSTGVFVSNMALGFKTSVRGITFEITDMVGLVNEYGTATSLSFASTTPANTANEYGAVYNLSQPSWVGDSDTSLGAFDPNVFSGALQEGWDYLRFFLYNPNENAVDLSVAHGPVEDWRVADLATLAAKAWTEVVLPVSIERNATYAYYIDVSSGAKTAGWQISPIFNCSLLDEVKDAIEQLDVENYSEEQITIIRNKFEKLIESDKAQVDKAKLIACETERYGDAENISFIVNGTTKYQLYTASDASKAASFVKTHIKLSTGATLPLHTEDPQNVSKYRYAIFFGYWNVYQDIGGTKTPDDLDGRADYVIERIGRTVFILANSADGYRMGALEFLRQTIGYDMIAEGCIVYKTENAATMPAFNKVGDPFDYRQKQTYMTEEEVYGMGLQSHDNIWIAVEGKNENNEDVAMDMHNTLYYIPTATYQSAHPTWYYTYTDSINVRRTQVCPTAGGSSAEFNAMVEAIAASMLAQINADPDKENISFSIMDTADGDDCPCTRCKLYDSLYGEGGFAAAWIDLMNAINAKIRPQLAEGKVLNIAFLAYRGTEKAPANIDANGNVTLLKRYQINDDGTSTQTNEDLKCDEGVTVWLAPINGKYAENLNHSDNATTLKTVKKWCALSDSVYLWMYGTNFKFYMYPYNTWQASAENYKILKGLGVKGVWSQSNETEATAFTDLKAYIDSKFMADVNADYETVLDTYFTNYFGPAATKMRAMFDKIVSNCNAIEDANSGLGRGIYDDLEYKSGIFVKKWNSYWTEDIIDTLLDYIDAANAAVDADSNLTDAEKTVFKNRIKKESLFPRYVYCKFYGKTTANRSAFKTDAESLGLTLYRESDGRLSDLYKNWDRD